MKSIISFRQFTKITIAGVFITILFFACTERIDIYTNQSDPHLVIYGYITTDTTQHYVRITRSASYFATTAPEGISGANVKIQNKETIFTLTEDPENPGLYLTEPDVYGVEGETYTLHVSVDFDGNNEPEEYTASSFLPFSIRLDSIQLEMSEYFDDRLDILVFGALPENSDENYLSFQAYRNEYALSDSLINWGLADDEYIDKKELKAVSCFSLDLEEEQYQLQKGDIVSLQVNSITEEYYDFIWDAQTELWGSNPIFSGPPANIQTNIQPVRKENKIPLAGFFTAYSFKRKGTVYNLSNP
ncbi:MAG: DUF4249 domain-containing protein [Tannerellaceae bacterium]|nr:DUF4249 domain-containing protein [Tannerellaceae bacterium]